MMRKSRVLARLSRKRLACSGVLLACLLAVVILSYDRRLSTTLLCSSSVVTSSAEPLQQFEQHQQFKKDCILNYKESCIIPKVVLLMSFPNSGTSYTLRMAQGISNYSIATNYNQEIRNQTIEYVIPGIVSPYKKNTSMPLPHRVLTKTHCTGYGDRHPLDTTDDDFDRACRSIDVRGNRSALDYSPTIVTAAVHLFRSPFDNLVARMHLWIRRQKDNGKWSEELEAKFAESPSGLLAWCDTIDAANRIDLERILAQRGTDRELYSDLPCLTEQWRYIEWHRHAMHFLQRHKLPTLVLYYEWYTSKYFTIVTTLLKFLQLDVVNEPHQFYEGKTYLSLYNPDLVMRMAKFMQAVASEECWELIQNYFLDTMIEK